MKRIAKKILLPQLTVTETSQEHAPGASAVTLMAGGVIGGKCYYIKPVLAPTEGNSRDGGPGWRRQQFNLFPVVLDQNGVPWAEAVVYLLSRLENTFDPSMSTFAGIADDLASFRRFLDETGVDWTVFPSQKLLRPTYRFNAHLKFAISAGEVSASTARRRMGTVIGFYRWLKAEGTLIPENAPWRESDRYIDITDGKGFRKALKVITTDISIRVPVQDDPYAGTIDDGGKLRPLPQEEQEWLVDALISLKNTEMLLIHLFALLTGARIQTVLSFKVRHVFTEIDERLGPELRVPIGPGTGIDTKNNKQMVLHIPTWFYQKLHIYAQSDRAKKRRNRAAGGDTPNQYLFLSVRGAPLYSTKEDSLAFDESNQKRHAKAGQGVRQFVTERVLPFIREKYGLKDYRYQFHDTRATAGMNWTDHQLKLVAAKKATLAEARDFVRVRMGHESSATTDAYLQFRQNMKMVQWAAQGYDDHLKSLTIKALEGMI